MKRNILFFICLICLLFSTLAYATSIDSREVTCPVDGFKFKAFELVSTNTFGGADRDGCSHAAGSSPLDFQVWTCPSCYYSKSPTQFQEEVDPKLKEKILKELKPLKKDEIEKFIIDNNIPGWIKYDLLATIYHWQNKDEDIVAVLYLTASWATREWERYLRSVPESFQDWFEQEQQFIYEAVQPLFTKTFSHKIEEWQQDPFGRCEMDLASQTICYLN